MAPSSPDPIRLRIVDADAETGALIASLLKTHTGRTYIVEPIEGGHAVAGMPATVSEAERRASEALRESEAQLAAVLADRERLERQFYQAQKMETVGRLAGGIAHDFNNMLTAIVGYGTARRRAAPRIRCAADARGDSRRANRASLTRQLLAFSRRQVLQPTRVDLNEIVTAGGHAVASLGEDIDLRDPVRPTSRRCAPTRASSSRSLMNLVINARDAMPRRRPLDD